MSTKSVNTTSGSSAEKPAFNQTRPGIWLSIGGNAFTAYSISKRMRKARAEDDTLRLVQTIAAAVALATGTLLLARELRRLGDDDKWLS
jgi:hypothetical protein